MTEILKVHGSENTFLLIDQRNLNQPLSDPELQHLAQTSLKSADKAVGGTDGLLVVNQPTKEHALAQMRVINSDGSEASMCGNGLRTVARYLSETTNQDQFLVDTMHANLRVRKMPQLFTGIPTFSDEISPFSFDLDTLPMALPDHTQVIDEIIPELHPSIHFSAVSVPNPHLIGIVTHDEMESSLLEDLGRRLNEPNEFFSDGVNLSFVEILGPNRIFVRTFERGVWLTNACGTGMSAATLVYDLTHPESGSFEALTNVTNPGGIVQTTVHKNDDQYWIELTGNATVTFKIEIDESDLHDANLENITATDTHEETQYQKFVNSL